MQATVLRKPHNLASLTFTIIHRIILTVFREGLGDEEREGDFLQQDRQKLAGFASTSEV